MRKKKLLQSTFFAFLIGFLSSGFLSAQSYMLDTTKVLVLNSYHKGFLWSDDIISGLEASMKGASIDMHVEYMDTKRQYDSVYLAVLTELYKYKLSLHDYEVIITSDDNAFNFALQYRESLFKNIPIVFCGINYLDLKTITGVDKIVGVNEVMDIGSNLELINRLHPDVEHIMVISENTTTGMRIQYSLDSIVKLGGEYSEKIELVNDVTFNELIEKVKSADENTVILYTVFFRDRDGLFLDYDESISMIVQNANVPVYTGWNFTFGFGVVGGYMMCGFDQGFMAGEIVKEIVWGVPIEEMLQVRVPESKLMFDFRVLKELGIDISDLPKGSEVVFEPQNFFRLYRRQLVFVFLLVLGLFLFSMVLLAHLRRSRMISKELKYSEDRINSLMSNILGAVYRFEVRDGDWFPSYLNNDISFFTGKNPEFFYGESVSVLRRYIHKFDRERIKHESERAIKERRPWESLYRMIHENGEERWVLDRGQGVWDETGRLVHVDGIIYDITDRKRAEDELVKSNRDLVKASVELENNNIELQEALEEARKSRELKDLNTKLEKAYVRLKETQAQLVSSEKFATVGVLATGIAHEINNPLNFIQVAIEALKDHLDMDTLKHRDIIEDLISTVELGVERTSDIVRSLNMFDRKSDKKNELCDIHRLIDNCLVMLFHQTSPVKVETKYEASKFIVEGNMGELHQVFLNLLMNSFQAMEEDGEILINTASTSEEVTITIEDDGQGISEADLKRVMDPFFTTKEPGEGTGLGMTISQQIIVDHGGNIDISSTRGQGTTIVIKLPVK